MSEQGISVLIADDDPFIRRLLTEVLGARDFDVVASVGNAEAAIAAASELQPALALVDYTMPGGGPAAAHGIRATSPGTVVVALSGHEDPATVRDMLAAGAATYLIKGTPSDEIVEALGAVLREQAVGGRRLSLAATAGAERVKVLIVQRDAGMLDAIAGEIARLPRLELVGLAQTCYHASSLAGRHQPDLALVDVRMPEGGALVSAGVLAASPGTQVLASTLGHDPAHDLAALFPGDQPGPARSATGRFDRLGDSLVREPVDIMVQPICTLDDQRARGYEALARFPAQAGLTPDLVFARAHRLGLGVELELRAMRRALEVLPRLAQDVFLAVNVSPETAASSALGEALDQVDAERVVLELTEHAPVSDYATLAHRLDELRAIGVRVAVDDCGAGFASLRHVALIGPEYLKLDAVLCRDVREPVRAALTRALVSFAEETKATVVAEGIEFADDLSALRDLGVPLGQGYLLARPDWPAELLN